MARHRSQAARTGRGSRHLARDSRLESSFDRNGSASHAKPCSRLPRLRDWAETPRQYEEYDIPLFEVVGKASRNRDPKRALVRTRTRGRNGVPARGAAELAAGGARNPFPRNRRSRQRTRASRGGLVRCTATLRRSHRHLDRRRRRNRTRRCGDYVVDAANDSRRGARVRGAARDA